MHKRPPPDTVWNAMSSTSYTEASFDLSLSERRIKIYSLGNKVSAA